MLMTVLGMAWVAYAIVAVIGLVILKLFGLIEFW